MLSGETSVMAPVTSLSCVGVWGFLAVVVLVMWSTPVVAQPTIQADGLFVVGKEKTILCHITSAEAVTGFPLYWSKNGVVVAGSSQETVPVVSSLQSYNIFYKFTVSASDNLAVFTCTATFPSGTTSASWTVYTYKGPDDPVITGPSSVVSGVLSTWSCLVDGASNSAPAVFWQFGNNSRLDSSTYSTASQVYRDSNQLEIHRQTSTLSLTLTPGAPSFTLYCRAVHYDTNTEKSADFAVTVLYPPQISGGNINYKATEGATATIVCEITANPVVSSVTWYKNGYPLVMTSGRMSGGTPVSPSLDISGVTPGDAGYYMCGASNSQGATNGTRNQLIVRYIPIISYSQNPLSGLSGSDLTLSCNIDSVPLYTNVFWYRINANTGGKTPIIAATNPNKYANGTASTSPALTIRRLDLSDVGRYRCVADNNVGRGEGSNLQVEVNYAPHISVGTTHYDVNKGENVTLSCDYDAHPEAFTISWVKNTSLLSLPSADGRLSGGNLTMPALTIHSVRVSDTGHYQCQVTSPVGAVSSSVIRVDVMYEPVVITPNKTYTEREGNDVTLTCIASGYPPVSGVIWFKAGVPLNLEARPGKYSGASSTSPSLLIHNVSRSDATCYACQAHNAVGMTQSDVISLDVTYAPIVSIGTTHYEVNKGENVTLSCDYDAHPEAFTISWVKNTSLLSLPSADGRLSGGNLTVPALTIHSVWVSDTGHYQCQVTSPVDTVSSSVIRVDVTYEPVITTPVLSYSPRRGADVSLACSVQGYPAVSGVIWYRAGVPVNMETSPGKYAGASTASPSLVIHSVTKDDSGPYTCQATNAVGAGQSDVITVNVTYAPILTLQATSYTRDVTESLTLGCSYDGNPSPFSVIWTKDSQVIDVTGSGGRYSGSSLAYPSLTINQLTSADAGLYVCSAANSVGQGSSDVITLTVNYRAEFGPMVSQVTQREGTSVTLPCPYSASPSPTSLLWFHNGGQLSVTGRYSGGTLVTPGLTISSLTDGDTGNYFCRVVNAKGVSDSPAIALDVLYPPVIISNNSQLEGRELSSLTIPCSYNANPSATHIYWTKDGVGIVVTSASYAGGIVGSPDLTIVSLVPADAGSYECTVVTDLGNASTGSIPIIVNYLPKINMGNTSEFTLTEGQTVTIHCRFDAVPVVTSLQWLHDGHIINMADSARYSGGSVEVPDLTVTSVHSSQAGVYQCRVGNDVGISDSDNVTVYVNYPPVIISNNSQLEGRELSSLTIPCSYNANPSATHIYWTKDGASIVVTSASYAGGIVGSSDLTIVSLVPADAGSYECTVVTDLGNASTGSIPVIVNYLPKINMGNTSEFTLTEGQPVTIHCRFDAVPAVTSLQWLHDGHVINMADSARYSGGSVEVPDLTVTSVHSSQAGVYQCRVGNDVGISDSNNVTVYVNFKPQISGSQGTLSATEPQSVTLTCQVSALPAVTSLKWVKDGQDVNTGNTARYSGGTVDNPSLTISSVGAEDGGQYYCEATNSVGTSSGAVTTLSVDYFPVFIITNTTVTGLNGSSVTLTVSIAANPGVTSLEWRKRDTDSSTSYRVVQVTSSGSKYQGGTAGNPGLQINSLSSSDSGYYTLVATNAVGTRQSSEFVVTVTSMPSTPSVSNVASSYLEGDPITLTCSSPSTTPSPSYRWLRGGAVVAEGAVLTVASAQAEDGGRVTCQAYNSLGSASVSLDLNVLYKPRASPSLTNVTTSLGQTVTLQCATQANPAPSTFSWTHNGQIVTSAASSSQLTVTVTSSTDLGSYSCQATNDVGTSDPIAVFILQGSSDGDGNVGASTGDSGLSTATLALIIIICLIILIVLVLLLIYCCSKRQCFRKDNDVGPTYPAPPPPPPEIPSKPYGYYSRGAVVQNGRISMEDKAAPLNASPRYSTEPGLTISLPGGHSPRPHHLPPLGQDGVPQEKESARGNDDHREKKRQKRRRRHDGENGSPSRHHDPDTYLQM